MFKGKQTLHIDTNARSDVNEKLGQPINLLNK